MKSLFKLMPTPGLADADGSSVVAIATGTDPDWSRDGAWIAFVYAGCDYYYGCYHPDGIAWHVYSRPTDVFDRVQRSRLLLQKYVGQKTIWVNGQNVGRHPKAEADLNPAGSVLTVTPGAGMMDELRIFPEAKI